MRVANDEHVPDIEEEVQEVKPHARRKPKRRLLPEDLPRFDVVMVPHEVEREGIDRFEQVGQEVVEVLERLPSAMMVVREWVVVGLAA